MNRRIRHWFGLPLLTKRERRNLTGFWFSAVTHHFLSVYTNDLESIGQGLVRCDIHDEFLNAIEWIEELKA